jgi:hypothetical protein
MYHFSVFDGARKNVNKDPSEPPKLSSMTLKSTK